jgi:hypothetical protein
MTAPYRRQGKADKPASAAQVDPVVVLLSRIHAMLTRLIRPVR